MRFPRLQSCSRDSFDIIADVDGVLFIHFQQRVNDWPGLKLLKLSENDIVTM